MTQTISAPKKIAIAIIFAFSFLINPYLISHSEIGFTIIIFVAIGAGMIFAVSKSEDDSSAFSFLILLLSVPSIIFTIITMTVHTHVKTFETKSLSNPAIVGSSVCGINSSNNKINCLEIASALSDHIIYLIKSNQAKELNATKVTEYSSYNVPITSSYKIIVVRKELK